MPLRLPAAAAYKYPQLWHQESVTLQSDRASSLLPRIRLKRSTPLAQFHFVYGWANSTRIIFAVANFLKNGFSKLRQDKGRDSQHSPTASPRRAPPRIADVATITCCKGLTVVGLCRALLSTHVYCYVLFGVSALERRSIFFVKLL